MKDYEGIREELVKQVLDALDYSKETSDEAVLDLIDERIIRTGRKEHIPLAEMKRLRQEIFYSIRRLDVLQDLLDDLDVTEIMINGTDSIFVEKAGRIRKVPASFSSREKLEDVIQQIVAGCNRSVNESSPIADARLPDGSRVNVVLYPAALNGPILTIRRFPRKRITMQDLIAFGSISEEAAAFLLKLTAAGYNIFISGGTGSGKTTFLNALSDGIPADERVITIEDNAELQITHLPNIVKLEARSANVEGCTPISIRDLIKTSLRMRPDRIIVGEVRGDEAIDMVQAMNTGHDGSLSSGHANSSADMMSRLETMILMGSVDLPLPAIRSQLASGIDIVVHLGRLRDKSRKMLEIAETDGIRDGQIVLRTLYQFEERGEKDGKVCGVWEKKAELRHREKLERAGITI